VQGKAARSSAWLMPVPNSPGLARHEPEWDVRLDLVASPSAERLEELARRDHEAFGPTGLRVYDVALAVHAGRVFEAKLGSGETVGGCQLVRMMQPADTLWLVGFYVLPEWRGRGVGESFLRTLILALPRLGARALRMTVAPGNEAAIRLYRRFGFRLLDTLAAAYGAGEDRYLLELRL